MKRRQIVALVVVALIAVAAAASSRIIGNSSDESHREDPRDHGGLAAAGSDNPAQTRPGVNEEDVSDQTLGARDTPDPLPTTIPDDYVFGSYDKNSSDDPTPRGCPMKRGVACKIRFLGNFRVSSFDEAVIRLGAYENDSLDPIVFKDLPVSRGSSRFFDVLLYAPSETATEVRFKVTLLTKDGKLIHEEKTVFPVPVS